MTTLTNPSFYDPANAEKWAYRPDEWAVAQEAELVRAQNGLTAAAADRFKLFMLMIDVQGDFCFPEGSLYVGGRSGNGAIDDNRRLAEFVYRNLDVVTNIVTTLDTHFVYQIFFSTFWLNENDEMPPPHTLVSVDDITSGRLRPNPAVAAMIGRPYAWLQNQVKFYCEELEKAGKYQLYIWPFHCRLGGIGHSIAGVIDEARLFHSVARHTQSYSEIKGGNVLTENYSVMRPEVLITWDGNPLAQKNARFLRTLLDADAIVIAGQAASHCVKSSIDDLLDEILLQDPEQAQKVYVMTDCMSSVVVPGGPDYTDEAEAALKRFADAGMNLVKSTDNPRDWPGIKL